MKSFPSSSAALLLVVVAALQLSAVVADPWLTHGGTLLNQRWAKTEKNISTATASTLGVKWAYTTTGDVPGTPTIFDNKVYFCDYGGMVTVLDQVTGQLIWSRSLTNFGLSSTKFSRVAPIIAGFKNELLIVGITGPAMLLALQRTNGSLVWKATIDTHPAAIITGAGTYYNGAIYQGVSSLEESLAYDPNYACCSFIGSLVKLNVTNGRILWKRLTLPSNSARPDLYSGGSVWGGTPAIDTKRGLVYIGTGNNYKLPANIQDCVDALALNSSLPNKCIEPGNYFNSILAINMTTGAVAWARNLWGIDAWNVACYFNPQNPGPNCPKNFGPDADFGLQPALATIPGSTPRDVLIAGQKSGFVWCLDRTTGATVWARAAGPGGVLGGIAWGVAVDASRVYVGIHNDLKKPFVLAPGKKTITGGGWVALNLTNGVVLWSTANPSAALNKTSFGMLPTVANGVVFVGSPDPQGHMYALSATTGAILYNLTLGASMYGGVAVDRGCVYFGQGYISFHSVIATTGGGPQLLYSVCVGAKSPPPPSRPSPPPPRLSPPPPSPPPPSPPPLKPAPKTVEVGGPNGWVIGLNYTWTPPVMYVGDKLRFTWPDVQSHNAFRFNSLSAYVACFFDSATELTGDQPIIYTLTSVGWYYFGCDELQHCTFGQKLAVRVVAWNGSVSSPPPPSSLPSPPPFSKPPTSPTPLNSPPPGTKPSPPPPAGGSEIYVGIPNTGWEVGITFQWTPPATVAVGTTLVFQTFNNHDLWLLASYTAYGNCDFTGGAKLFPVGITTFRYKITAPGTYYFACSLTGHCPVQKITIVAV